MFASRIKKRKKSVKSIRFANNVQMNSHTRNKKTNIMMLCCVVCMLYSSQCRDGHRCVQNWPDWIGLCILLYMSIVHCTLFIWPHVQHSGECVITFVCKRGETKWTPETKFFIFEKIPRKSRRIRKWKTQNRKRAATQIIYRNGKKGKKEEEEKSIVDMSAESQWKWNELNVRSIRAYSTIHTCEWVFYTYDDMLRLMFVHVVEMWMDVAKMPNNKCKQDIVYNAMLFALKSYIRTHTPALFPSLSLCSRVLIVWKR